MYKINSYTFRQAKKIHVKVKPSRKGKYKLDVFDEKTNKFITSIGANGYSDYPTFIKTKGKKFADERRRLYKIRHEKDRHVKNSRGYYADKLLW